MQRAPSPPRRTPSPGREQAPRAAHPRSAHYSSASSSASTSTSTKPAPPAGAAPARPKFSALKFAARQKVPRGDTVLQMKTEYIAHARVMTKPSVLPEDRFEPQLLSNEEDDFQLLRRQFSALTARHRSRWVKAKLESPCGQEWQTLLDCYLDKGAHPMLCLEEEAAMRRCKQRLVRTAQLLSRNACF